MLMAFEAALAALTLVGFSRFGPLPQPAATHTHNDTASDSQATRDVQQDMVNPPFPKKMKSEDGIIPIVPSKPASRRISLLPENVFAFAESTREFELTHAPPRGNPN
jgi:hypothetical protein